MPLITGTDADEALLGTGENDTLIGNAGADTISGGGEFDIVAYWTSPSAVAVELFSGRTTHDGFAAADLLTDIEGVIGSGHNDFIYGNDLANVLNGLTGGDTLFGLGGDDLLQGAEGDDRIDGGLGNDTAVFVGSRAQYTVTATHDGFLITDSLAGRDGSDTVLGTETFRFADRTLDAADLVNPPPIGPSIPNFTVTRAGITTLEAAQAYAGPVTYLEWQYIGDAGGEIVMGTGGSDFVNLLSDDDACNGGEGNDVIDGGTGSNFLHGGVGQDVFFLDGRAAAGGSITWSTITDWEAGEQLSIFGFRPDVSQLIWVEQAGAQGYMGATMHADLDGNGVIDTSVTWSGVTREQLSMPLQFDGLLWFT